MLRAKYAPDSRLGVVLDVLGNFIDTHLQVLGRFFSNTRMAPYEIDDRIGVSRVCAIDHSKRNCHILWVSYIGNRLAEQPLAKS